MYLMFVSRCVFIRGMSPTHELSETDSTRGAYGEEGSLLVGDPLVGDDNPCECTSLALED